MKVTHKRGDEYGKSLTTMLPGDLNKEEMPASLYLSHLPSQIDGMPEKGDFHAHIKGKVRRHETVSKDGKTHHNYDLDVHHFEAQGKDKGNGKPAAKKKKSDKEELDEAFDKHFGKG
jgi:hypothetical protein